LTTTRLGCDLLDVDRTLLVADLRARAMRCDLRLGQHQELSMRIDELEARVRAVLPPDARTGASVRAAEVLGTHEVEVIQRVDRNGLHVTDYYCDGARMERGTLLRLLCHENACPLAKSVQQRWRSFRGLPERASPRRVVPLRPAALMVEIPVEAAGHRCIARPGIFECLTPCPMGAHDPQPMHKSGWDLFEDGIWLAGGLCIENRTGTARPRFESPAQAQQWLAAQETNSQTLLARCR
jgi:hypothetical protein